MKRLVAVLMILAMVSPVYAGTDQLAANGWVQDTFVVPVANGMSATSSGRFSVILRDILRLTRLSDIGAEPAGTAATALSGHTAALNPHDQYQTQAESDARYSLLAHGHTNATLGTDGFMSAADKSKLTGIAAGAVDAAGAAAAAPVQSVSGRTGAVTLAKGDVGLGAVDNTADADKPVSTAVQTALDLKADTSSLPTLGSAIGNALQVSDCGACSDTQYTTQSACTGGGGTWTAVACIPVEINLNDIADVNAPTPADGNALVWDQGTSKWIPGASGVSDWADLTGKPEAFPPVAHGHTIAEVMGLPEALDAKAAQADLETLQAQYDNLLALINTGAVPPALEITSAGGWQNSTSYSLTARAIDTDGLAVTDPVQYSLDGFGTAGTAMTAGGTDGQGYSLFSSDLTSLAEADHTVTVRATDAHSPANTAQKTVQVRVDTTAPTVAFTSLASVGDPTYTLTGTVTNGGANPSPLSSVQGKQEAGGSYADVTTSDGWATWSAGPYNLTAGSNTLYAKATDAAGNTHEVTHSVSYSPPAPISDNFSTNTAGDYTAITGGIAISGGAAYGTTSWQYNYVLHNTDTGSDSHFVQALVQNTNDSGYGGVVFGSNGTTGYVAQINTLNDRIELKSFNGATLSNVLTNVSAGHDLLPATNYLLKISKSGSTFTVSIDGSVKGTMTDSTYATGSRVGLFFDRASNGQNPPADNLEGGAL